MPGNSNRRILNPAASPRYETGYSGRTKELLGDDPGRNFDIESIFVERLESGKWRWVVYEFLKAEPKTIDPKNSHPNYYWYKNKRKFLSLWTVVQVLRKAGCDADLILVNYAENRNQPVKEMLVKNITEHTDTILRAASVRDGSEIREIREHVSTIDSVMSFEQWKEKFREFNRTKKGDTWELLKDIAPTTSTITAPAEEIKQPVMDDHVCSQCTKSFTPRYKGAKLCLDCWKLEQKQQSHRSERT